MSGSGHGKSKPTALQRKLGSPRGQQESKTTTHLDKLEVVLPFVVDGPHREGVQVAEGNLERDIK